MNWNFPSRPVPSKGRIVSGNTGIDSRSGRPLQTRVQTIIFRSGKQSTALWYNPTQNAWVLVTLTSYNIFLVISIHTIYLTFLECLPNFLQLIPLFPMLYCVFSCKHPPDSETLQFDEDTKAVNFYLFFPKDICKCKPVLRPLIPLFLLLAFLFAFLSRWFLFVSP